MRFSDRTLYAMHLRVKLFFTDRYDSQPTNSSKKNLYVSCVGQYGKAYLKKIIQQFGHENFDFLIIVFDNAEFKEEVFSRCQIIRDQGLKWMLIKKHISVEYGQQYGYIFLWDDDIDVELFSVEKFLNIVDRNNLEIAQPALTSNSYHTHEITLHNPKYTIGRRTDFVEIMVPVIKGTCWRVLWSMLEKDYNGWGWGYDDYLMSKCHFNKMGIVDQECVTHTKPTRGPQEDSLTDMERFRKKNKNFRQARLVQLGSLK